MGVIFCVFLFFESPFGESNFNELLMVFGISPGIPMGSNSTLYIYGFLLIAALVICIKRVFKYWHSYGLRFKDYHFVLKYLPLIIGLPLIMQSFITINPSLTDRMYFFILSRQRGVNAVTYHMPSDFRVTTHDGENLIHSYSIIFQNHGNTPVAFTVILGWDNFPFSPIESRNEVLIMDANNNPKTITIAPRASAFFNGDFIAGLDEPDNGWWGDLSISSDWVYVLLADNGREYRPRRLAGSSAWFR